MKTITKKMLSVLMAVLVLLGGIGISLAIEPLADAVDYDMVYDYANLASGHFNTNYRLEETGACEIGDSPSLSKEGDSAPGINPGYGDLYDKEWGTVNKAYIVYNVAAGSKFEATFKMAANNDSYRKKFTAATGEPFEFTIEASANGTDGWKSATTTEGMDGTVDPDNSAFTDVVVTYNVPKDCSYVKITFPQQGKIPCGSWTPAGNDMARLCKVRFAKYVDPAFNYDSIYDYSDKNVPSADITTGNILNYGIYALNTDNAHKLIINGGIGNEYNGGIGGEYGDLSVVWGTKNKPYVIYKVKDGTKFETTLRMLRGRANTAANANLTGLEATIEASVNGVDNWTNLVDTTGKSGTTVGGYEDITITYDVPEDCNFVKITLPMQGIIPNSTYRGNDLARIMRVKYFKYVDPTTQYDTIHDYCEDTNSVEITNDNKGNFGIYALNDDNAHKIYSYTEIGGLGAANSGGIGGGYGDLGTVWGTKNKAFVIYKVKEGTKFEATLKVRGDHATLAQNAGLDSLGITIEASSNTTDGWGNKIDTKNLEGAGVGSYLDYVITYDVPADCNYVKITLPMQGIIPNSSNNYRGNDLARIMRVKYFKYVEPAIEYDTPYDYSDKNAQSTDVNDSNKANFGIYALNNDNAHKLILNGGIGNEYNGGIGGEYGDLGTPWGTKNKAFVIYKVKEGTKFEATFRMLKQSGRDNYATIGQLGSLEATIESSANGVDGWANLVDTAGKAGTKVGGYEDITITYDVPADCNYVKLTLPMQGIIPNASDNYHGNDLARIMGVKYFKYVAPAIQYEVNNDYSDKNAQSTDVNDSNKANFGIYALNNDNAHKLILNGGIGNEYNGGIGGEYGDLGTPWGTKNKAFVIYKVKEGTKFEATFRMLSKTGRDNYATIGQLGSLEATIESSPNGVDGWANLVDTAGKAGTKVGGYEDITITYDVPADCNYVKITLPMQGIIPNASDNYHGNDLARIMSVKHFKYVEPAIQYEVNNDYSDTNASKEEITESNKANYGIYALNTDNAHKLYSNVQIGGAGAVYSGGIGGDWGDLGTEWGTKNKAFAIYAVKEGTKFEATFRMLRGRANYAAIAGLTGLEATIESSKNGVDNWTNLVDTAGKESTVVGGYEDITITYDVPADCNYVKITLPMQGIIPNASDNYRGNDLARIMSVKHFKYEAPPIQYEENYDYSDKDAEGVFITDSNKDIFGIFALNNDNSHALFLNGGIGNENNGGIGGDYGDLGTEWGTKNKAFVVYRVKEGSKFEVTLRMLRGRANKAAESSLDSLEATILASKNGVDGWKSLVDTEGKAGVTVGGYEDITITYDVPADCNYVKITLPMRGILPGSTYRGNDLARIMGVKYFRYDGTESGPVIEYEENYDYADPNSDKEVITQSNMHKYGIYGINTDNAHKLYSYTEIGGPSAAYSGGIGGEYGDLGTEWGTKNKPYVIYRVKEGTKFEATFRLRKDRANMAATAGLTGLEATIETSSNGIDGWKNVVDTAGKAGESAGGYEDITITYDVPEDCNYVKITLPMQGIIPNDPGNYRGNDLARIMVVRYFKYIEVGPAYTFVYDYSDINATVETITNGNKSDFGIHAINTDNAHKLVCPTTIGGAGAIFGGGIGGDYGDLGTAWGTKNKPYVIYKVEAGKPFEVTFRMVRGRANYAANAGLAGLEATIEASFNGTDGWKNLVDTADKVGLSVGGYEDITITYNVPSDCQFVKITLPMQGIIPNTENNYRGNDLARIMNVKCFGILPPVPTYDKTYDYSDKTVESIAINGSNIADYGIYSYNNSPKAPGLVINEMIGNDYRGGIHPGFSSLGIPWNDLENTYVVYEVKPGTFFEATIRMIGDGTKNSFAEKTGEPFEVTLEASSNDLNGWKNKVDTSSASKTQVGGYCDYVITYEVPVDCSFVKITFPQKGIIPETTSRGNDAARLMKVRLNAAKNFYEGTETVMNYKANGALDFFYDNDAALIYLYQHSGIVIENFSNGAAYVAPSMDYLNSGANVAKPYVVYAVESGTKFVAALNVNRAAAAELGSNFAVKLYQSANGTSWTEASTEIESLGDIDYITFTTASTAKYVKVEFPHTSAVKNVDKVNEVYGLMAVGFSPNKSAYEIENPYGDYEFANVDKFYGDAFAVPYDVQNYGIYEDIGGVFNFEAKQGDPYYYLAYTYINLVNNQGSDRCGFVYSVKPGTAFQAVALLSRNNGDVQLVEKVTGERFDIIVQVSSDGKNWTDYNPSRILTDKSLMELDGVFKRYITEVITIPVLPSDAKFVKLLYPHTASVKVMTGGVDNRAGNDFLGLAQVSFTKGDAVPAYLYDPDRSKYEDIYDFTTDTYNLDELNTTGIEYAVNLGALTPSWNYFYNTGKNIREKCAATVSVKEGTAFYLDFCYRPDRIKLMEGENYSVKLLFSSDCINWTDVTEKYVQVKSSFGDLNYAHRFEIDKLPDGVKYVKVEYPHDHDMRGDVTAAGKEIQVLGNDNCGIKKIYFTADDHHEYKHEIKYGYYFEEYEDFPEDIDKDTAKVLGIYDFSMGALKLNDHTASEASDGRIVIKENYIFNKEKIDPVYLVYNVVPGTEFYMKVMTTSSISRLTLMPMARMKIYASETGKDGSWKEITNYFYTDKANNSQTTYYVNNVGDKTNFIKVEFPITGDLVAQGLAEGASGATFFAIKEVCATLVDYNPDWGGVKQDVDFKKPTLNNKVDGGTVVVNTFNWLYVIIPVAAVLVLAAAAVVVILIIKKKKKTAN